MFSKKYFSLESKARLYHIKHGGEIGQVSYYNASRGLYELFRWSIGLEPHRYYVKQINVKNR